MNLFRSLKVDEREMYIWFVVPAPFLHAGLRHSLIYGVNGSGILLQIPGPIHGLTSYAKIFGIWQGMLPHYLRISRFNGCSLGIFCVLDAWAVHDIYGSQNFRCIASMRVLDPGGKLLWMT